MLKTVFIQKPANEGGDELLKCWPRRLLTLRSLCFESRVERRVAYNSVRMLLLSGRCACEADGCGAC